jgi:hypothetical protein
MGTYNPYPSSSTLPDAYGARELQQLDERRKVILNMQRLQTESHKPTTVPGTYIPPVHHVIDVDNPFNPPVVIPPPTTYTNPPAQFSNEKQRRISLARRLKSSESICDLGVTTAKLEEIFKGSSLKKTLDKVDVLPKSMAAQYKENPDMHIDFFIAIGATKAICDIGLALGKPGVGFSDGSDFVYSDFFKVCQLKERLNQIGMILYNESSLNHLSTYFTYHVGRVILNTMFYFLNGTDFNLVLDVNFINTLRCNNFWAPDVTRFNTLLNARFANLTEQEELLKPSQLRVSPSPSTYYPPIMDYNQSTTSQNDAGHERGQGKGKRGRQNSSQGGRERKDSNNSNKSYNSMLKGICRDNLAGQCTRRNKCRFEHKWGTAKHIQLVKDLKLVDFETDIAPLLDPTGPDPNN